MKVNQKSLTIQSIASITAAITVVGITDPAHAYQIFFGSDVQYADSDSNLP